MPAYGLFPAKDFVLATGREADCASVPQALWYFSGELLAVPRRGLPLAGYAADLSLVDDLAAWEKRTPLDAPAEFPPLVWVGSSSCLHDVRLGADGKSLAVGSESLALSLAPRLPSNRSWFNAASLAYFRDQPLKLRGTREGSHFVARTFWPESFRLPARPAAATLPAEPAALLDWLRAEPNGGACSPFAVEALWRRPDSPGIAAGQPLLGLMLNGAQGDDDESHSGHFAVMTGRVGVAGAIDDCLVNNFYTLDTVSEKGIIAAPVLLDNYLGDLNSGQAWYRPSYLLLVTLTGARVPNRLQSAFGRVYNQFYRHQFAYQHARANCTGISVTTARQLGWQVPVRGAESWLKAIFALPLLAVRERSLGKGKAMFDYLTEDRTRLYPAVAFAEMGADLMRLAAGRAGRPLSLLENALAEDIDGIYLVRVPQFPSSRAWGNFPVDNSVAYLDRIPADPARRQIVPVPPRPFPDALRDPQAPAEPPLRSDYAVFAWALAIVVLAVFILRRLLA